MLTSETCFVKGKFYFKNLYDTLQSQKNAWWKQSVYVERKLGAAQRFTCFLL